MRQRTLGRADAKLRSGNAMADLGGGRMTADIAPCGLAQAAQRASPAPTARSGSGLSATTQAVWIRRADAQFRGGDTTAHADGRGVTADTVVGGLGPAGRRTTLVPTTRSGGGLSAIARATGSTEPMRCPARVARSRRRSMAATPWLMTMAAA
ncbi:hypothetical protein OG203_09205 [Nocardia sp. NBC_01499]|uniref:hypothetical protein n=1 Tax=Nocardia sp. NBC_01499 TaxID=2903597 RepID=UPI003869157A